MRPAKEGVGRAELAGHRGDPWSGWRGVRMEEWHRRLAQVGKAWSTVLRGCFRVGGDNDVSAILNLGRWRGVVILIMTANVY